MSIKWKSTFILLLLTGIVVWLSVFSTATNNINIISCNVGQGDASLVVYKSFEILIDGGPDNSVLECLSKYVPFWDREIEMVILTHPQQDHYKGLIAVLEHYKVRKFLANSLDSGSQDYSLLKSLAGSGSSEIINPVRGMTVRSEMIQLDILHPSAEFLEENLSGKNVVYKSINNTNGVLGTSESKTDPNDFSIVALLHFGSFKFLFTGDISKGILDNLASDSESMSGKPFNYIKIPHHGSRTALSESFYNLADPDIAVMSVGKNSYNLPNSEVINYFKGKNILLLRTDEMGDVVVKSDGKKIWIDP